MGTFLQAAMGWLVRGLEAIFMVGIVGSTIVLALSFVDDVKTLLGRD